MQTSARRGIEHPSLDRSDRPDIPDHIQNLVDALEVDLSWDQGITASRPADPGYSGFVWWSTDDDELTYWDGTNWNPVGATDTIAATLINAKGDLVVGLSDDTPARLPISTNGHVLTADSAQVAGMKWALNAVLDLVAAKGDILAGAGADSLDRVAVGPDGTTLIADAAQTAGVRFGSPVLEYEKASLSADVTLTTANTFYDGPSVSLDAGVWHVRAYCCIKAGAGDPDVFARLIEGTTTVLSSAMSQAGGATDVQQLYVEDVVEPSSTTAYTLRGATGGASGILKAATPENSGGNNATRIIAVRIG